jgi:peroxiredoxin
MKKTFLLFALLVTAAASQAQNKPAEYKGLKPGDYVEDFNLKNVDGRMVSMNMFSNMKGFIVIFTCNHCPYSVAYEDRINELNKKYLSQGYMVIAVNPNDPEVQPADSYEAMQVRAKEKSYSFPYLFDEGQKVLATYGAQRTPHAYVLSRDKKGYKVEYVGAIDDNHEDAKAVTKPYIENAVDALLKGKTPDVTFTKAIGCSVKVKKA